MTNATEIKVTRIMALDKAIEVLETMENTTEYIEVLGKIKASVSKKSESKTDKAKAEENGKIRNAITEVLDGRKMRVSDITKKVNEVLGTDFTSNKVSAQVTILKNEGVIMREVEKKVAYFSLA